jgi:hypothetical protein
LYLPAKQALPEDREVLMGHKAVKPRQVIVESPQTLAEGLVRDGCLLGPGS